MLVKAHRIKNNKKQ